MRTSVKNNKDLERNLIYIKKVYPDGKLPKWLMKEALWESEKERDDFIEKFIKEHQRINEKNNKK